MSSFLLSPFFISRLNRIRCHIQDLLIKPLKFLVTRNEKWSKKKSRHLKRQTEDDGSNDSVNVDLNSLRKSYLRKTMSLFLRSLNIIHLHEYKWMLFLLKRRVKKQVLQIFTDISFIAIRLRKFICFLGLERKKAT